MPNPKRMKPGPRPQAQRKPGQPTAVEAGKATNAGMKQTPAAPNTTENTVSATPQAPRQPAKIQKTTPAPTRTSGGGPRSYRDLRAERAAQAESSSPFVRWARRTNLLIPIAGLAVILVTVLVWILIAFLTANNPVNNPATAPGLSTPPALQGTPDVNQGATTPAAGTPGAPAEGATPATTPAAQSKKQYSAPPPMTIDPNKQYFATIETNQGNIKVQLLPKDAPATVNSFVFLSREGFYNGLTFHRVIKDFMIQGGDPKGDGTGGPGYEFKNENASAKFSKGLLAMANSGPDTNGSQFFITTTDKDLSYLNGKYTIFGKVVEGQDVADKISLVPTNSNDKPVQPVIINKITIEEK